MKKISTKIICLTAGLTTSMFVGGLAHAAQQEQAYTTAYRYSNGLLTGTIAPDPDGSSSLRMLATRNTYENGLLKTVEKGELQSWADENTQPSAWSGFTLYSKEVIGYDAYGRKASMTVYDKNLSALSLTEYSYDERSRIKCTAKRMDLISKSDACSSSNLTGANPDRITRFTYDAFDQVTTEERAVGTGITQNYVTNVYEGRKLRYQVDANCNKTELRYDNQWLLARVVYPSTTKVLSAGQTCDKPAVPNTLPANAGQVNEGDYVEYRYDGNGNKNYERKRNKASIALTLDNKNRVTFKNYSNGLMDDISYNYDLRGLQLSATFLSDSGKGIINTFDGFGNLASVTNSMFGIPRTLKYQYDLNNNRTSLEHPDGVKFGYKFDGLNRLSVLEDSSAVSLLSVGYQPNGRRNDITRSNGATTTYQYQNGVQLNSFSQTFSASAPSNVTTTFTFNASSQIESLNRTNSRYNYQGNDNRTGDYITDGLNRYKSATGQTMGYDGNSNLYFDGLTYYNYDDENRLLSMSQLDNSSYTPKLTYDPNGRLFEVKVYGQSVKFMYDGDALVAEWSSENSGVISRRYVHGDQVDEPLVQYNGDSTGAANRLYLHSDHQGSIIAQSNAAGTLATTLTYDAFGIPGSGNVERFGYTGQIWLKDLGLNYYKARMYSSGLGRFLQTDPIGYKDQMNLYAYVGNDPINNTDPSGLECSGTGASSKCTIDKVNVGTLKDPNWVSRSAAVKSGAVTDGALKKLEGNITKSFTAAQKAGGATVTIEGSAGVKSQTVSGNDAALRMRGTEFGVDTNNKNFNNDKKYPMGAERVGMNRINYFSRTLDKSDLDQQKATLHEVLHEIPTLNAWDQHPLEHQAPFNKAAEEILNLGQ